MTELELSLHLNLKFVIANTAMLSLVPWCFIAVCPHARVPTLIARGGCFEDLPIPPPPQTTHASLHTIDP